MLQTQTLALITLCGDTETLATPAEFGGNALRLRCSFSSCVVDEGEVSTRLPSDDCRLPAFLLAFSFSLCHGQVATIAECRLERMLSYSRTYGLYRESFSLEVHRCVQTVKCWADLLTATVARRCTFCSFCSLQGLTAGVQYYHSEYSDGDRSM